VLAPAAKRDEVAAILRRTGATLLAAAPTAEPLAIERD